MAVKEDQILIRDESFVKYERLLHKAEVRQGKSAARNRSSTCAGASIPTDAYPQITH